MAMGEVNRFWLFAGPDFYPDGGVEDLVGFFDSLEDAIEEGRSRLDPQWVDWFQVVDTVAGEVINGEAGGWSASSSLADTVGQRKTLAD